MLKSFGVNKKEKLKRSTWTTPLAVKTAFAQGTLIPLGFYDVIPNSTIKADVHSLVRLALTPYRPFMGDMYFTYGAYFVPYRILYHNYPEMFGNGKPSEWSNPTEYLMPASSFPSASSEPSVAGVGYDAVVNTSVAAVDDGEIASRPGNLADYLGLPFNKTSSFTYNEYVNIAPFLAYERIWTDYWRDENYQNPDPDLDKAFFFYSGEFDIYKLRFSLHYANKFHDYFTSVLPGTQKGQPVGVGYFLDTLSSSLRKFTGADLPKFGNASGTVIGVGQLVNDAGGTIAVQSGSVGSGNTAIGSSNLGVSVSVNELRLAFALQRASERNARTGSRSMTEAMQGIFEAKAPAVLNMAEFLGGNTVKLNMMSVPQTGGDAGKLGAFSATGTSTHAFIKTFDEPGLIMFVGTTRIKHNYTQGIDRYWSKTRRYHFYDPALAHISEQPIYAKEFNYNSVNDPDDVIGFQEPWVEYVKPIDKITGYLRDPAATDMKKWVLQDYYAANLAISPTSYYPEKGNEVAAVTLDYNSNYPSYQFIADFQAALNITAPKPVYSIPGFIDHIIA